MLQHRIHLRFKPKCLIFFTFIIKLDKSDFFCCKSHALTTITKGVDLLLSNNFK